MVFGLQALPVRSEVAAPELRKTLLFSRVIWFTASATDEVGTSTMASTLSTSYQVRAMVEPTSGLFWWSAADDLDLHALGGGAEVLDRHLRRDHRARAGDVGVQARTCRSCTPILMTPSEICACAAAAPSAEGGGHQGREQIAFSFMFSPSS